MITIHHFALTNILSHPPPIKPIYYHFQLEESIFIMEILSKISLMKGNNGSWIQIPAFQGASASDSKAQRNVRARTHNHALMLGCVFGHFGQMRL